MTHAPHHDPIEQKKAANPVKLAIGIAIGTVALIIGIILTVQLAVGSYGSRPMKGDPTMSDKAVANRIAPVAQVAVNPSASTPAAAAAPAGAPAAAPAPAAKAADAGHAGKSTFDSACTACHTAGVAGAPKLGDKAAWATRLAQGTPALYNAALKGKGAMPAKGGNATLSDDAVKAAVDYMLASASNLATYAVGDLQGCYEPLARLVDSTGFDAARDRLWFVGDLVNRGPDSLACLRFVKSLGPAAVAVLGNHDLHLLCVAHGVEKQRKRDTIDAVLAAPDRDELLEWLRHRPLLHAEGAHVLVHAGLLPEWTVARALELAGEVEARLRGGDFMAFLEGLYGDEPSRWDESLAGIRRLRVIVNAMTRLRVMDPDGSMALAFKGEPEDAPGEMVPWFDMPGRKSAGHTIVCGHWSALGLKLRPDIMSLDSGCVWGRSLSAVRLGDRRVFAASCRSQGREG